MEQNLQHVRERIGDAALRAGRDPTAVRLVAVTKTHPVETILAAWALGQRDFGENRPHEGVSKIVEVQRRIPGTQPTWHMIGTLQRRKVRLVIEHFDYIHAVDRTVLAEKLSALAVEAGRSMPALLECNVSGEGSKAGFAVAHWDRETAIQQRFFDEVRDILALPGLKVAGLMTMAPLTDDPETVRPVFASLRGLRDALADRFPGTNWVHLSMGMTDDFEVAIEEGATLVRIGRAIFGSRT
ncbi:MAG: YggS family pyridoxal phosphate-dependent enzyme [Anaerolineae bacterium]|nr:YggS family pyridoxal phosphate-dependent enzyme [Anaerolineae bacterium]